MNEINTNKTRKVIKDARNQNFLDLVNEIYDFRKAIGCEYYALTPNFEHCKTCTFLELNRYSSDYCFMHNFFFKNQNPNDYVCNQYVRGKK